MANTFEDPVRKFDAELLKRPLADRVEPQPVAIGNESQLFVDDHLVARTESLFRRLNRPRKAGRAPFLAPEKPWEGHGIVYGCVVPEKDHYRFYYKAMSKNASIGDEEHRRQFGYGKYCICLATGGDPTHFEKNPLESAVVPGTNIVVDDPIDDFTILKDPTACGTPEAYKMLSSKGNWWAGLSSAVSADGIRWNWKQEHAVQFFGDRCSYWFDPMRRKHIAWSRNYQVLGGRHIFHKETSDFSDWGFIESDRDVNGAAYRGDFPRLVMTPDRHDHEQAQFYGGYGFWYESLYIGYLEMYHIHQQRLDTQLVCSRDGISWTRLCDREVFLANGEHDEFDAYWIVPTFNPPILHQGRLLIHYNGRKDPHAAPGFRHLPPGMAGAFGIAEMRQDGFVSLDATGLEGMVETRLLQLRNGASSLQINCCAFDDNPVRGPMEAKIAVLDEAGNILSAHELIPVNDPTHTWYTIRFEAPLPSTVRLRFHLKNCRLYSFRFG